MPEKDASKVPYHPFDLTKVWPHKDYPMIEVGVMELNRNPENFFAEVEQSAFNPANVVPGIGFSPDKMLQARLFSYGDAQRYRLGVNHRRRGGTAGFWGAAAVGRGFGGPLEPSRRHRLLLAARCPVPADDAGAAS